MTNPDTKPPRRNNKTATLRKLRPRAAEFDLTILGSVARWQSFSVFNRLRKATHIGSWAWLSDSNATHDQITTKCLGGAQ